MKIAKTLKKRNGDYGEFMINARISQNLKDVMRISPMWNELTYDKKEALDMIALKIGRLLTTNPDIYDHWHDIIGYTTLVQDTLPRPPNKPCKCA